MGWIHFFLLYDNPATRLLWPLATNHVVVLHPLKMLRYSTPVDIQSVGHFARSDTCVLGYKLQNGLSSFWSTFLVHLSCFWSTFLLSLFFFECEVIIHRFLVLREARQYKRGEGISLPVKPFLMHFWYTSLINIHSFSLFLNYKLS